MSIFNNGTTAESVRENYRIGIFRAPLDRVRHKTIPTEQEGHPKNIVDMILHTLYQNSKQVSLQAVPLLSYVH